MKDDTHLNRRGFLGAGLLAAGTAAGWATGCSKREPARRTADKPDLDGRFQYDISAYTHTDPALLLYEETASFPTALDEPRGLAMGPDGALLIAGDQAVRIFAPDGKLQSCLALAGKPLALAPAGPGRFCVAMKDHLVWVDGAGKLQSSGEPLGPQAHLTSVVCTGDAVFAADAGHREIIRFDGAGRIAGRFGKIGARDGSPGFMLPSPYFHLALGPDGLLWANNPGRHSLEAYTPDGKFELAWGTAAMSVEGFCGCCNPVYFALRPDGKFVTSEKGLVRIKLYDAKGKFEGVVAGPEQLVKDRELAAKACVNCSVGFGFDVACDAQGRVLALDPAARTIRVFTPKAGPIRT